MLVRIERKLVEMQRWVDVVGSIADWPSAMTLAMFKTRPPKGAGFLPRWFRQVFPQIWIRPAKLGGLSVRVDPSEPSHFVIFEEVFMKRVYDLDAIGFTPTTIVDCGAFEGHFSLLAAARFPGTPIIAFEPNTRNMAGLRANLARNHLAVDARAAAVSTWDGTADFSGAGCGGHLGPPNATSVTVPVINLCRVIAELEPDRLLLKLDVEGEEATLLPALLPVLPRQCAIYFEWHHGRDTFDQLVSTLAAHGFVTTSTRLRELPPPASADEINEFTVFIDAFAQRL